MRLEIKRFGEKKDIEFFWKFEHIPEGRNLLDNNFYNQRLWSDITNYQYNYLLRPVTVMFKIRFNLGV